MSVGGEPAWIGKKLPKRLGGMVEALSIATDLGFSIPPPIPEDQSLDKSDELIKVLRDLTSVQSNIANLQVELQGRKDRIIARLQQPYSLDCIPVEAEYQKQFSELLLKAVSDYGALTASVADFQWSQNFRESPAVWGEMLRPIPAALASCTRFFEAMSAMRDSLSTLHQLRVGQHSSSLMTPATSSRGDFKYLTPQWRDGNPSSDDSMVGSWRRPEEVESHRADDGESEDGINHRRLSWAPPPKKV